jgi:hypothetical protein
LDQAPKIRDALGVAPDRTASPARRFYIALLMFAVVLLAILRSAVATRLDSFTIDENYHITAGVSYLRTGDYRINPEHPPLVKLWVAAFMPESVLHLGPLQVFNDKGGERNFTADTVFLKNDPDRIQRHARLAMYCFNGLLLFIFALVARRVFGSVVALGALAFLVIDPTVAAHMPVVMTDLPVTLLGATAVLLSWLAFETWKPAHLAASAIALGLTLATKHSGIIFAEVISAAGLYMALRPSPAVTNNPQASPSRPRRLLAVVVLSSAPVSCCGAPTGFATMKASPPRKLSTSTSPTKLPISNRRATASWSAPWPNSTYSLARICGDSPTSFAQEWKVEAITSTS